jgi:hypothetical protein
MAGLNPTNGEIAANIFAILIRNEMDLSAKSEAEEEDTGSSIIPTDMQDLYDDVISYLSDRAIFKASPMAGTDENPNEHIQNLCERLRSSRRYVMQEVINERALEKKKLLELSKLLKPPTPTPGPPKRVVVDISDQRVYAYEGDTLVYNFIASTGEPGRDTAVGEFEILNKIPMAYASTWNLDMPNWLGVYWSGSLQNGFHALPTVRHTGYTLWDGFLGQRVSYGCIILSYTDSQILYDWVEIGTPVTIQY